jgi:proliferating cell nuclear antigen
MAFEAVTRPGGGLLLRKILETLRETTSVVVIEVSHEGISAQAMDDAQASLLCLHLPKSAFAEFRGDPRRMGIDLGRIIKILRFADSEEDVVGLRCDGDAIVISINGKTTSEFTSCLIYLETSEMAIPEDDHAACVSVNSSDLTRVCKDLSMFGDSLNVTVGHPFDVVRCTASNEFGTARVDLPCVCEKEGQNFDGLFSSRYLNSACKGSALNARVQILLDGLCPLQMRYDLPCGGTLKFYLAPKVRDDDE